MIFIVIIGIVIIIVVISISSIINIIMIIINTCRHDLYVDQSIGCLDLKTNFCTTEIIILPDDSWSHPKKKQ